MDHYGPRIATTTPKTLEKRREVMEALRALAAQHDEQLRRRRADIAALRYDLETFRRDCGLLAQTLPRVCRDQAMADVRAYFRKYSPDQPRVPAGNPDGGEWTDGEASGASGGLATDPAAVPTAPPNRAPQFAAQDTGTRTDAPNVGEASGADTYSSPSGVVLAGDVVTPHGFTVEHLPNKNPLDPQGLNKPIAADEQQKIADALTLIENGDTRALQRHPYGNLPHHVTGAVLPESTAGYTAYDVPGLDAGRGEGRLLIDNATRAIYYTNNHYQSFYSVQVHRGD